MQVTTARISRKGTKPFAKLGTNTEPDILLSQFKARPYQSLHCHWNAHEAMNGCYTCVGLSDVVSRAQSTDRRQTFMPCHLPSVVRLPGTYVDRRRHLCAEPDAEPLQRRTLEVANVHFELENANSGQGLKYYAPS
jgi:hypothetical protein